MAANPPEAVKVGNASVMVKQGDITGETTDAIVNLNNEHLNQNFGVSKSILAAAGPAVQMECRIFGALPQHGIVVTGAGNLNCKRIIHLINVTSTTILTSVKEALEICDQHKLTTVAFPAIGTGASNVSAHYSIKSIMRGIEEYLTATATSIISYIHIVVLNPFVYQKYLKCMQNYQTIYPHIMLFGKMIELIKGDITNQDVDCILNLTNQYLNQTGGVSGAILSAAGDYVKEECKKIGYLNKDEIVVTSGGNTKATHIMHMIGPTSLDAYEPALDMVLLACHNNGFKSVAIPATGTGMANIDTEKSIKAILKSIFSYFRNRLNTTLETVSIIVMQDAIYQVYLKVFQEKCYEPQKDKKSLAAAAEAQVIVSYPSTWSHPEKHEHQEIELRRDSTEFKEIEAKFLSSSRGSYMVVKIVRIQDVKLWQSFSVKKQAVDRKYPRQQNIQHLYHGTSIKSIDNINKGGFNRIYCGKNGTSCGTGTYFAVHSSYSCQDKYSAPDSQGHKYVYQAMVITGNYCRGDPSYKEPPHIKNDPNGARYDSVVDNMQNVSFFVVFHDDLAYPEYLITFRHSTLPSMLRLLI
ncbi:protein mono-ADP-ribosyltransferase PARP15-like isoform X2 [Hyperolius riggenbachi]|uniref:protein mono-ADP-ribosyltransferase PARP15-like isoform X2 n=1 Tax=Hyperolius riggenbachi TaxID=752182 RepID=UPI0035A3AFB8